MNYATYELKDKDFKPEYAGKINFYLSAVDDLIKHESDQPSIGLILCKSKNNVLAEYTLRDMTKPIGLAEYRLMENLPDNLKTALPTIKELEAELAKDLDGEKKHANPLKPTLIPATLADYPVIQNMARFYAYDMSRDCGQQLEGWEFPEDGLYECADFKKYLEGNDKHAFLIKIDDELAGFAFVNKLEVMPEVDWNMGEFFIVAKFQRTGIGNKIAKQIFDQFSGEWSVGAIPQNTMALNFWRKIVTEYTHGKFHEVEKTGEQLKTSDHPDPYPMIILRFKTPSLAGE